MQRPEQHAPPSPHAPPLGTQQMPPASDGRPQSGAHDSPPQQSAAEPHHAFAGLQPAQVPFTQAPMAHSSPASHGSPGASKQAVAG